jgi:hypothetical protein
MNADEHRSSRNERWSPCPAEDGLGEDGFTTEDTEDTESTEVGHSWGSWRAQRAIIPPLCPL